MRNSSYILIPILLKLYRCCNHALKICMLLENNPQINFLSLFWQFELSHFKNFTGVLGMHVVSMYSSDFLFIYSFIYLFIYLFIYSSDF